MDRCVVTQSLDSFKRYLDPSTIPAIAENTALSFDFPAAVPMRTRLYVIKPCSGVSLLDLIEQPECCDATPDDLTALRVFQVNETVFARERSRMEGDTGYVALLSAFVDPAFVGVLAINVCTAPKKPAALGPMQLVDDCTFIAPCIELTGFDFSGVVPVPCDTHIRGYVVGTPGQRPFDVTDATAGFSFKTDRLCARYADSSLLSPSLTCSVQLFRLFSQTATIAPDIKLVGTYAAASSGEASIVAYRFALTRPMAIQMGEGPLSSVSIERVSASGSLEGAAPSLRLLCDGAMRFSIMGERFDPLGFGTELRADGTAFDGYLAYTGLDVRLTLSQASPSCSVTYRTVAVDEKASLPRPQSFIAQFPHRQVAFMSFQDGGTPQKQGFHPIVAPPTSAAPLRDQGEWFGLLVPVDFVAEASIELLFAFSGDGSFSCFARFGGSAGSSTVDLALSSFFSIRFREAVLCVEEDAEVPARAGAALYVLVLRGLKLRALSMQLPEGSCDVAMLRRSGETGWYAVYDHRRSDAGCDAPALSAKGD